MIRKAEITNGRVRSHAVCFMALFVALLGVSCRKPVSAALPQFPEWDGHPLAPSQKIDVDFYVDASVPIRGFLAETGENQTNYFKELLDKSNGILKAAWPDVNVQYWRFGGGDPQATPSTHDVLGHPAFFNEQKTRIDLAIAHEVAPQQGRSQLKIILTDMFQDQNDVDRLATQLNSRYLRRADYAVGVLGVRNVFHGVIDDLPGSVPPGAADSLPFYMLIVGPVMDVNHAMHAIVNRIGLNGAPAQLHFIVLYSQRLVNKLSQRLTIEAVDRQPGFTSISTMVKGATDRGIPQIAIPRRDVHLKLGMLRDNADRDRTGTPLLQAEPTIQKTVFIDQNGANAPGPADAFDIQGLQPGNDASGAQYFGGRLTIHGKQLAPGTVYLLQIDTMGEEGDFEQLRPWYLEISDVPRILRNKKFDQTKDGAYPGKTPNLRHFLQTIADKTFQSKIPLGRYYMFVQVN